MNAAEFREWRERFALTQHDLAKRLGVTPQAYAANKLKYQAKQRGAQ